MSGIVNQSVYGSKVAAYVSVLYKSRLKIKYFKTRFIQNNTEINAILIHFIKIFLSMSLERVIHLFY
jgi:hypothetical protein